jgi:hypothetical protein
MEDFSLSDFAVEVLCEAERTGKRTDVEAATKLIALALRTTTCCAKIYSGIKAIKDVSRALHAHAHEWQPSSGVERAPTLIRKPPPKQWSPTSVLRSIGSIVDEGDEFSSIARHCDFAHWANQRLRMKLVVSLSL